MFQMQCPLSTFAHSCADGESEYFPLLPFNFKTRENNGHPTYASVIYNADTKKLSWKSNDTKWENSHEVQTSAERDHKLWFTVSCQYTTKFEVVCTSWVQPESSLSAEFLDMIKRYVDLDIILSHTE